MKTFLPLILAFVFLSFQANAQYEHRFSATVSGGMVFPFSSVETFNYSEGYPAAFGNFGPGYEFNVGFNFNPGKRLIFVFNFNYMALNSWYYDYYYSDLKDYNDYLFGENLGFSVAPRLYFNPRAKVRVYMQVGVSANFLSLTYDAEPYNYNEILDGIFAIGVQPLFGMDIQIADNMGIFINAGLGINFYDESQFPEYYPDKYVGHTTVDLQKDNLNFLKVELGYRFNFLKSKKL